MSIDGVNSSKDVKTLEVGSVQSDQSNQNREKMNCVFSEPRTSLRVGTNPKATEIDLQPQEEVVPTLSRKEANNWIENYVREHRCSKKDAILAFENCFGYKVPDSKFNQSVKKVLNETNYLVGVIPSDVIDGENNNAQLTRKEAKTWIKNYILENQCSKKEARQAFKENFGYEVPDSKFLQSLRGALLTTNFIGTTIAATHSAEERANYVKTGKWNS